VAAIVTEATTPLLSLDSAVTTLAAAAGLRQITELSALDGGRNNRVYRLVADGKSFLLKQYFHHPADPRDRGATEFAFLRFAWDHGVRCVPEPIAWDSQRRLSLSEFVEGRRFTPDDIDDAAVDMAAAFYRALNSLKATPAAGMLPNASEACFSIAEHVACVDRRIERLRQISVASSVEGDAAAFVEEELSVKWSRVKESLSTGAAIHEGNDVLSPGARCLSPSDFGFHNALRTKTGICFLDFEYAGWDDPAKTVCDFFCQPAVPVPSRLFESFAGTVTAHDTRLRKRIDLLFPAYQIKWCCIILNHFAQIEAERRSFAGRADLSEAAKRVQLEKARVCLSTLRA
jgi:hypothetical protein